VNKLEFQRDAFIDEIYKKAKKDKNVFFLSADFGAPALDRFRKDLKNQFIHCGISEQNMVNVAAGLALEGKKVFMYAMAPFITLRCLEQHKCCSAIMKLPINTIVAGIGLGYADSGPTHYTTEDTASLKSLVGSKIYTASDAYSASLIAKHLIKNKIFSFSRLERLPVKKIYSKNNLKDKDINNGFKIFKSKNNSKKNLIITQGYQIQRLLELFEKNKIKSPKKFDIIDLFQTEPIPNGVKKILKNYKNIIIIDEQIRNSSLISSFGIIILESKISAKFKGFCLKDNYVFDNGGREKLLNENGISIVEIKNYLNRL
tara:strand:- start:1766 stop:2713 length:948 start_codon:yes stop_codon:yes gene_type:complete